jgi:hypothetical protein
MSPNVRLFLVPGHVLTSYVFPARTYFVRISSKVIFAQKVTLSRAALRAAPKILRNRQKV